MMKSFISLFSCALSLFLFSCTTVENNYRSSRDFASHLVANGVPVEYMQPAVPGPLKATEGVILRIAGKDLGVYKFDKNAKVQRERLEKIKDEGAVYFLGAKYVAIVSGSFVLIDAEKNPRKDDIIKAFKTFQ